MFPRLPYSWLMALSKFLGSCGYLAARSERRVALANLEMVFGRTHSLDERRRITRRSFQSFARMALETLASRRLSKDALEDRFDFAPGSREMMARLALQGRGVIALTFHYGNWEWLSLAWGMAGHPFRVVTQPIKNPRVEELFRIRREQAGHQLLHRRHAARQLYKCLKRGEMIGLLVDLNSSINEGGAFFDFFGLSALTTRAAGLLAMKTCAPIVCSVCWPIEDGRYHIKLEEIPYDASAPLEADIDAITRRWLARCEAVIRERPECWMWMYKRWKARPTEEAGRYPFYSFYDPKMRVKSKGQVTGYRE